jgi:hypothetical protein
MKRCFGDYVLCFWYFHHSSRKISLIWFDVYETEINTFISSKHFHQLNKKNNDFLKNFTSIVNSHELKIIFSFFCFVIIIFLMLNHLKEIFLFLMMFSMFLFIFNSVWWNSIPLEAFFILNTHFHDKDISTVFFTVTYFISVSK